MGSFFQNVVPVFDRFLWQDEVLSTTRQFCLIHSLQNMKSRPEIANRRANAELKGELSAEGDCFRPAAGNRGRKKS